MNILDRLGLRQRQQIVISAQILGVTLEAFGAEIAFRELMALDHRAHGAVEDQDFFARQPVEGFENPGAVVFIESHAVAFSRVGRTPSKWQMPNTRSARLLV